MVKIVSNLVNSTNLNHIKRYLTMNHNSIEERLIAIAATTLGIDGKKISVESNFVDDLGADSLDQVELIMALEAAFGCDIPDEDAKKILTVKDAIAYVQRKTAAA